MSESVRAPGVLAFWKWYDRKLYLRMAQLAEDLGYDSFWVPEGWGYEAFSLLTEIACHTKRIKLGTGIVNVFSRSPALLAMHAATLDEISEGRFILGVGTSGARVVEDLHGREYTKPLSGVRDTIKVIRTLLAGEKISDAGATLREYRPFKLEMTPARADVPIYVAALRQKSIESIGELADGWIPTFWPHDRLKDGKAWIAAGAERAGRDASNIVAAPFTGVTPDLGGPGQGDRTRKEVMAFYIGGMGDYYKELLLRFGYEDLVNEVVKLYSDKRTRAQAADAIPDDLADTFGIAGSPEHCREELKRRREWGLDLPILSLPTRAPEPAVEAFLRALSPSA